jgi:hypothetical protein
MHEDIMGDVLDAARNAKWDVQGEIMRLSVQFVR